MQAYRSDLTKEQIAALFAALDDDGGGMLTRDEFVELPQYIEVQFVPKRPSVPPEVRAWPKWRLKLRCARDVQRYAAPVAPHVPYWVFLLLVVLVSAFALHRWFQIVRDFLVIANGFVVAFLAQTRPGSKEADALSAVLLALVWVFFAEITVKMFALTPKVFFRDAANLFDVIVVVPAFVLDNVALGVDLPASLTHIVSFLRVLRVLRMGYALDELAKVIRATALVLPVFVRYLIVMLLFFYFFAILGMELFAGRIYPDVNHHFSPAGGPQQVAFAGDVYWNNNFDTLLRSYVTLFELMVVNNWVR